MARHSAHYETETLPRNDKGQYDTFAWPGGYPIFYLVADNGVLCANCANGLNGSRATESLDPQCPDDDQWRVIASDVNWEDDSLFCDHCGQRIESAYAEGSK